LAAHLVWARVGSAWGSAGHAIDRAGSFGVVVHLWYTPAKFTWPGQLPRAGPDRSARGHQRRAGLAKRVGDGLLDEHVVMDPLRSQPPEAH
jgi:hypothetical protein